MNLNSDSLNGMATKETDYFTITKAKQQRSRGTNSMNDGKLTDVFE